MDKWYERLAGSQILSKKYFHEEEDFEGFIARVADIFPAALQKDVRQACLQADFFPGGRSLYAAGSKGKFKASMSNCYIMPMPEDNIESIFDIAKECGRIFSYGGGIGVNLSNLRPKGAKVHNSAKTSTGAVSFIDLFNTTGDIIGSNNRRAALMIGLNCDHPDVEEFLQVKQNNTAVQSANLSILFTDAFMQAVQDDGEYELSFWVEATGQEIRKTIRARAFFWRFCEAQWDYAEPGAIFIDRARRYHLLSGYPEELYRIDICNPCAEYFGNAYNACNLGSINLYHVVKNPFTPQAAVDTARLEKLTALGVEALDAMLDYGYDMQPLPANRACIDDWRAIGLGVFGLADMLVALGIRYGGDQSLKQIQEVMQIMQRQALATSCALAREKGAFGKYDWEYVKASPLLALVEGTPLYEEIRRYGLRNGSLLSIAPTGSIATMAGMSGGAEPLFAISYDRTTHALEKTGTFFRVYAKSVEDLLRHHGIEPGERTREEIQAQFPFVVTAHDIAPLDRVRLQAAMQTYVDNAISSTVNLKHEATAQDVYETYLAAWRSGCKGLTIFRDGCRRSAILTTGAAYQDAPRRLNTVRPMKRSDLKKIDGSTMIGHTACVKNLYTTVNKLDDEIFEVFTNVSSGCKSNINTITRLTSLALRCGVKVEEVVGELKANVCPACSLLKQQGRAGVSNSCGSCVGEAIELMYKHDPADVSGLMTCPSCGKKTLRPEGKCYTCTHCTYSKCD